ncbi:MAG: c-type cytochrome [Burkholderiaceae bacterium]|jgi:cytochrome c553
MRDRLRKCTVASVLLALCCASASYAQNSPAAIPDTLEQRLKPCTECHSLEGRNGTDGYYPRIAGKPEGYLFNQLVAFRDGGRHYLPMRYLLSGMPDRYLHEIAAFFAGQKAAYVPPGPVDSSPAVLERGKTLALSGDPKMELPACSACHGQALMGVAPYVPALIGLPRHYINSELGAWKTGTRTALAPDCMAELIHRLSDSDANAVAAWLASQAVPAGGSAAARADARPPLVCGSIAKAGGT